MARPSDRWLDRRVLERFGPKERNTILRNGHFLDEAGMRRFAIKHGYVLNKSRQRTRILPHNKGGYMLTHSETNIIVAGPNFDANLREIADFLDRVGGSDG